MAGPIDPRLQQSDYLVSSEEPKHPSFSAAALNPSRPATALSPSYYSTSYAERGHPAIDPALGHQGEPHSGAPPAENDSNDGPIDGPRSTESSGAAASPGADSKRTRSCDSCRHLKVKCVQDPTRLDLPCERCKNAKRQCITTPPTRKRQRKADTKVAELEKKIDGLFAQLAAQNSEDPEIKRRRFETGHSMDSHGLPPIDHDAPPGPGAFGGRSSSKSAVDRAFINQQIDALMDRKSAERIFNRYVNEICPAFPAVPVPPGTTADEMREKKPLLFLAILTGSSFGASGSVVPPDVQQGLSKILKDIFADVLVRNVEKSLEVVQALQLGVLWYRPPANFEQHNFYLIANNALLISLDLGLGKRASSNVLKMGIGPFRRNLPDANSIEARRTFLVCYYLCISITMVLRRPILLRWNGYMEESLRELENSPDALPSDRVLCQHMRLAHLCERIASDFFMDDPTVDIAISDPKITYALSIFENDLRTLTNRRSQNSDTATRITENVVNLYIHEIALHYNNSTRADFHVPFGPEAFTKVDGQKNKIAGPAHVSALEQCLLATHGILDTIIEAPLDTILMLPVIFCVRSIYALVCLIKMWVTITSPGELGELFSKDKLHIDSYLDRIINMFQSIMYRDSSSPHAKFFYVTQRLRTKFNQIKEGGLKPDQICGGAGKGNEGGNDHEEHTPNSIHRDSGSNDLASRQTGNANPVNQTPLHLLSEVAMGSSGNQQSQPQVQQPNQMPTPNSWYENSNIPNSAPMQPGMDGSNVFMYDFSVDLDYSSFGMGGDMSSLLMYDPLLMDPNVYTQSVAGSY